MRPVARSQTFQLAGSVQQVAFRAVEAALGLEREAPQRMPAGHEHVWREVKFSALSDCRTKGSPVIAGLGDGVRQLDLCVRLSTLILPSF